VQPDDLRSMAATLEAEGIELAKRGDTHAAATRLLEAGHLRQTAKEMEKLLGKDYHGNTATKVAESLTEGLKDRTPSGLRIVAGRAGYSLRSLAAAVGLKNHSYLSMAHAGRRPLPREIARRVEQLTGFKAVAANWPGGLKD
jgi:hypothetical protein